MKRFYTTLFILIFSFLSFAQTTFVPMNDAFNSIIERHLISQSQSHFSSTLPLKINTQTLNIDSLLSVETIGSNYDDKFSVWWRKLRKEHLIQYKNDDFTLNIDPIINFSRSSYYQDYFLTQNSRGIEVTGNAGRLVAFKTGFVENQMFFPNYLNQFIKSRDALPGLGRASKLFKGSGYDFSEAYGLISIDMCKFLNLELGHSKQFIGNGYRSLFQSYNAFNLPFTKLTTSWGKWQYINLWQILQKESLADATTEIEGRRYNSTHILSYLPVNNFEISLIESVIFAPRRTDNYFPNLNLLNPIIGYRSLQYGETSEQNVVTGINLRWDIFTKVRLYSQMIYNGKEKFGWQIGFKSFDYAWFNLPLLLQIEYNRVEPNTYTHYLGQTFTHANQELAHPLGADFTELITKITCHWKGFYLSFQANLAEIGSQSIFPSEKRNIPHHLVDQTQDLKHFIVDFSYLINPANRLSIFFSFHKRDLKSTYHSENEQFYTIGIRTGLHTHYNDF